MTVGGFAVLVHSETDFVDGIAGREPGGVFGVAHVERNHGVAVTKLPHCAGLRRYKRRERNLD